MKLTDKQKLLIHYINSGVLRKLPNGDYYYSVPTYIRRNSRMIVKKEFVSKAKKAGLITMDI